MSDQNQEVVWDRSHHSIFEDFALDLQGFTNTGKYPSCAGQDVKYGLELQLKRLKEKNLVMKYDIQPRGHFAQGDGSGRQWKDDRYVSSMEYRTCRLSRMIYRSGKKIYEMQQNSILYQIITNVLNSDSVSKELYSCPNCGAVSKIADLQNGCPYCGTYFEMQELYPKVTNYYFIKDNGYTEKEIKRDIGKVILPCIALSIIGFIAYFCKDVNFNDSAQAISQMIASLLSGIFGGMIFGGISGYILWAFLKITSLFVEAGKAMPLLVNSAGSGGRFVSFMKQYSPEFSYEYFSDKIVSMTKMIIFSEHPEDLPFYEGEPLDSRFLAVIESSYTGAVALKQYGVQGDYCYVTVDVYLDNLYDNGSRIDARRETIHAQMRKNIRKPIDINFSVERIQCKSCGTSFNAAKIRNCPHCGTRYEMGDDDWTITWLR